MPRRDRARAGALSPRVAAAVGGLVLLGLLVTGIVPRLTQQRELRAEAAAAGNGLISVYVAPARRAGSATDVTLPGTVQALHEAQLYARTSGYVRRWYADIGAKVRAGQLLAELSSPDLDQELLQAKATALQSKATAAFAKTTYDRWKTLERDSAVSLQELDQTSSGAAAAEAAQAAADANVRRLAELKGFTRIVAPFNGVVTVRTVDVGALVTPGTTPQSRGLFSVAQIDSVRVYVTVPESYAPSVQLGRPADVRLASAPGRSFQGVIARTSRAVDPTSRTLLTEVVIPNRDGSLFPGSSATVSLKLDRHEPTLMIPAAALLVTAAGTRVAVVSSGTVTLTDVTLGRDFGDSVEVLRGIPEGQMLVLNPRDDLLTGMRVQTAEQPKP